MREHKLIRLFVASPFTPGEVIRLGKEQSHYLINVMRRKLADKILVFNGQDGEYKTEIINPSKDQVHLEILEKTREQHNSLQLTLIYSPVKTVKSEFIVQKATELGATKIQPVILERTIKDKINQHKLNLVAAEAAEQCERLDVPEVLSVVSFDKIIRDYKDYKIILCDETGKGKSFKDLASSSLNKGKWAIIIGPEGGFSDNEIKALYELPNVIGLGLGPRILRAETAIIAAIALWQVALGDWGNQPDFRG